MGVPSQQAGLEAHTTPWRPPLRRLLILCGPGHTVAQGRELHHSVKTARQSNTDHEDMQNGRFLRTKHTHLTHCLGARLPGRQAARLL